MYKAYCVHISGMNKISQRVFLFAWKLIRYRKIQLLENIEIKGVEKKEATTELAIGHRAGLLTKSRSLIFKGHIKLPHFTLIQDTTAQLNNK